MPYCNEKRVCIGHTGVQSVQRMCYILSCARDAHLGMERRAHHVVVMTGEHGDASAALPVPDADRL